MSKARGTPQLDLKISFSQILTIAVPMMGGLFFHAIITLTEMLFVSRVGRDELGALGVGSLFYMVVIMIGLSISQGAQILIARRAGEGKSEAIGLLTDGVLFIALAVSLVLFVFVRFGSILVMDVLIEDSHVYELTIGYLHYRSWGIMFTFLVLALGGFYTGIGRTMPLVWSASAMALANIALNDALVFGRHGFPEMGLQGSALAALISEALAFFVLFSYAIIRQHPKEFRFLRFRRPDRKTVKQIASMSGPIALQQMTGSLSWFLFFVLVENEIGKQALAASNVLRVAYLIMSVPARALGGAAETLVSNVIGQGKLAHVHFVTQRAALISLLFSLTLVSPLILIPHGLLALVAPQPDVVAAAISALPSVFGALMLLSVGVVFFRSVSGTGSVAAALRMELIVSGAYLTYACIVMKVLDVNLAFGWTSEIVYWLLLITLSYAFLRRGKWAVVKL